MKAAENKEKVTDERQGADQALNVALENHPEIQDAIDAMVRITAVEDIKARHRLEEKTFYQPVR